MTWNNFIIRNWTKRVCKRNINMIDISILRNCTFDSAWFIDMNCIFIWILSELCHFLIKLFCYTICVLKSGKIWWKLWMHVCTGTSNNACHQFSPHADKLKKQEVQGPWRSAWQLQLGWYWQLTFQGHSRSNVSATGHPIYGFLLMFNSIGLTLLLYEI